MKSAGQVAGTTPVEPKQVQDTIENVGEQGSKTSTPNPVDASEQFLGDALELELIVDSKPAAPAGALFAKAEGVAAKAAAGTTPAANINVRQPHEGPLVRPAAVGKLDYGSVMVPNDPDNPNSEKVPLYFAIRTCINGVEDPKNLTTEQQIKLGKIFAHGLHGLMKKADGVNDFGSAFNPMGPQAIEVFKAVVKEHGVTLEGEWTTPTVVTAANDKLGKLLGNNSIKIQRGELGDFGPSVAAVKSLNIPTKGKHDGFLIKTTDFNTLAAIDPATYEEGSLNKPSESDIKNNRIEVNGDGLDPKGSRKQIFQRIAASLLPKLTADTKFVGWQVPGEFDGNGNIVAGGHQMEVEDWPKGTNPSKELKAALLELAKNKASELVSTIENLEIGVVNDGAQPYPGVSFRIVGPIGFAATDLGIPKGDSATLKDLPQVKIESAALNKDKAAIDKIITEQGEITQANTAQIIDKVEEKAREMLGDAKFTQWQGYINDTVMARSVLHATPGS